MIELDGLTKRFGKVTAVSGLSFRVSRGEALGFIGPNGAGKTTTIRMLATLLKPDAGTATINGHDIVREPEAIRACVGYMPDFFGVYDDMKVWEYLDFFAAAYRIPHHKRPGLISDVLELTDLGAKREAYVDSLSRGMKQRLCLAKTLVHDPEVLLLDEPASGLDPAARIEIRELLKELCRMNKTIVISSHILTELADMCGKVAIIERGQLVAAGGVDAIAATLQVGLRLIVRLTGRWDEARAALERHPDVAGVELSDPAGPGNGLLKVAYRGEPGSQHGLLTALVRDGFEVLSFTAEELGLEDVYMRLTRGEVS